MTLATQGGRAYLVLECLAERPIALAQLRKRADPATGHHPLLVRRYELPNLHALQFVCERALDAGVTTSAALDPHGKRLSYALPELGVETAG